MKHKFTLLILLMLFSTIKYSYAQDYTATKVFGKDQLAVRELRQNAISGNIGWNSLTGVGFVFHNYVAKQMEVELGVGLSSTGVKFGGRFTYLFSKNNFSPFVAAGFNYGTGFASELENTSANSPFTYKINASPFIQIAGGIEYLANKGFLIKANLGYAALIGGSNYEILSGNPTNNDILAMDLAYGSGIVIEFSIGYAFGSK